MSIAGRSVVGSASTALQLSDILGTALGTGVAGAILAASERAGADTLGTALAAVFAVSLVAALGGMLASRRLGAVGTGSAVLEHGAAAVD